MWDWQRFTLAQLTAAAQQWQRDQEELLARALVTLQEARHAHQEELKFHRDRQQQQDICLRLREKVSVWYTITQGAVMIPTLLDGFFYVCNYATMLHPQSHFFNPF